LQQAAKMIGEMSYSGNSSVASSKTAGVSFISESLLILEDPVI